MTLATKQKTTPSCSNLAGRHEGANNQSSEKPRRLHSTTCKIDPAILSLRGKLGGLANAAKNDPRDYTARARSTFLAKFEHEVDPDGILPEGERLRRAEAAKKAHFARMALKSAKKRARRCERC